MTSSTMIAIASGKGGVGKTWFSITLAHALAAEGRRVLLFDGDLGLANVDVQLGLTPERDLSGFIADRIDLADTTCRYGAGGFEIIAGRSGCGSLAQLPPSRHAALREGLRDLAGDYDFTILDMGAGIDRTVRSFSASADMTLVVTTDEPTAITDAYAFIKVSNLDRGGGDQRLVVNMAGSVKEGEQTHRLLGKACRQFLKLDPPLAGVIRRDTHVRESIRRQTPLLTRFPGCEAANDVRDLAARLIAEAA